MKEQFTEECTIFKFKLLLGSNKKKRIHLFSYKILPPHQRPLNKPKVFHRMEQF